MKITTSLAYCLVACTGFGQGPISSTSNGVLRAEDANKRFLKLFKEIEPSGSVGRDIALYKVIYGSRAPSGRTVPLSGLVAIPVGGAPKGLVIYFHATTANRENVPSRFTVNQGPEEAELAVLAFASAGYAVAAPDYLGLGDHHGVHPYPFGDTNCWSGIDLILPARDLAKKVNAPIGPNLYVSGYSEGGGVAMWAARRLQDFNDPNRKLTAAAPLSGAYDLSGTQAKSMLETQSNMTWWGARVFLAAYAGYAMHGGSFGVDLKDYFAPSFATYIPFVFNQNLDDDHVVKKLVAKALQMGSFQKLDRITTERFRTAIRTEDVSDPFVRELSANNCYDWSPKSPLFLFCIADDFVVVKENTLKTIAIMRARGVGPQIASYYSFGGRKYNHMTGVVPALIYARRFFDRGFAGVPDLNN
jgi:pimeloyl-ACP methyl ester carboxylesterase